MKTILTTITLMILYVGAETNIRITSVKREVIGKLEYHETTLTIEKVTRKTGDKDSIHFPFTLTKKNIVKKMGWITKEKVSSLLEAANELNNRASISKENNEEVFFEAAVGDDWFIGYSVFKTSSAEIMTGVSLRIGNAPFAVDSLLPKHEETKKSLETILKAMTND